MTPPLLSNSVAAQSPRPKWQVQQNLCQARRADFRHRLCFSVLQHLASNHARKNGRQANHPTVAAGLHATTQHLLPTWYLLPLPANVAFFLRDASAAAKQCACNCLTSLLGPGRWSQNVVQKFPTQYKKGEMHALPAAGNIAAYKYNNPRHQPFTGLAAGQERAPPRQQPLRNASTNSNHCCGF